MNRKSFILTAVTAFFGCMFRKVFGAKTATIPKDDIWVGPGFDVYIQWGKNFKEHHELPQTEIDRRIDEALKDPAFTEARDAWFDKHFAEKYPHLLS